MKSPRSLRPGIITAALITLAAAAAPRPVSAEVVVYRGYEHSYGSFYGGNYYYSELDREDAERDAEKQADRDATKARMEQAEQDRLAEHKASRKTYVPKAPEETSIIVNIPEGLNTTERAMQSMLERDHGTPPQTFQAPPKVAGTTLVVVHDEYYYYKDGSYFIMNGDELAEVPAPPGAMIFKLPEGFQTMQVDGQQFFLAKGACYSRVMLAGQVAFKVVDMPGGAP